MLKGYCTLPQDIMLVVVNVSRWQKGIRMSREIHAILLIANSQVSASRGLQGTSLLYNRIVKVEKCG